MVKYETTISAIGPLAAEFLDAGIVVLFNETAPEELAEFAVLHGGAVLQSRVAVNDLISFDDVSFRVLAVGNVANDNLANLGHLVIKFNGNHVVEMPGDVCVEAIPLPTIRVGTRLRIISAN